MQRSRHALLRLALLPAAMTSLASAQEITSPPLAAQEAAVESPAPDAASPAAQELLVHIELEETELKHDEVLASLQEEFGVPLALTDEPFGLQIHVKGNTLTARYVDDLGKSVERQMELPPAHAQKLDTVALLAGNLARDEAGDLLAQLRPQEVAPPAPAEENVEAPLPPVVEQRSEESKVTQAGSEDPVAPLAAESAQKEVQPEKPASPDPAPQFAAPENPRLKTSKFAFSLTGSRSYPDSIHDKKVGLGLGLFYSDFGALKGFAGNVIALRNRGADRSGAGSGVQLATGWVRTDGYFKGVTLAVGATSGRGGHAGAQLAVGASLQNKKFKGTQLAVGAAITGEDFRGVQGAVGFSGTWRDFEGVQLGGAGSYAGGNFEGTQLSLLGNLTQGEFEGFQLALLGNYSGTSVNGMQLGAVNVTPYIDGTQVGLVNTSYDQVKGVQVGIVNVAGDFQGTQVGVLNIGGKGKGSQFALVNVAADLEGTAIAPINVIPGARNQLLTYVSYSDSPKEEGLPGGPMTHVGLRVLPGPIYTQMSFGLGPEARECPEGASKDDPSCTGGGAEYALGLALGGRVQLIKALSFEMDIQYLFEKAFGQGQNMRHSILARPALSFQAAERLAIFAGAGPQMTLKTGPAASPDPELGWLPQFYGGLQLF